MHASSVASLGLQRTFKKPLHSHGLIEVTRRFIKRRYRDSYGASANRRCSLLFHVLPANYSQPETAATVAFLMALAAQHGSTRSTSISASAALFVDLQRCCIRAAYPRHRLSTPQAMRTPVRETTDPHPCLCKDSRPAGLEQEQAQVVAVEAAAWGVPTRVRMRPQGSLEG